MLVVEQNQHQGNSMLRKVPSSIIVLLLAVLCFVGADAQLRGDNSRPKAKTDESKNATTVPVFGGGQQPIDQSVQFLLTAPGHATVSPLDGDTAVALPGRLNLELKSESTRFRLTQSTTNGDVAYFGSLSFRSTPNVGDFVRTNAIAVNIADDDLRAASTGVVTQFIYLPHRRPTEKWAGHLGTLTMAGVTLNQRNEVLNNLKRRGHLLVVVQIAGKDVAKDNQLPSFAATDRLQQTQPRP